MFSKDGRWLIVQDTGDSNLYLIDLHSKNQDNWKRILQTIGATKDLIFSEDSRWLSVVGGDGTVYLFDMSDSEEMSTPIVIGDDAFTIEHTAFAGPGKYIVGWSSDRQIRFFGDWTIWSSALGQALIYLLGLDSVITFSR